MVLARVFVGVNDVIEADLLEGVYYERVIAVEGTIDFVAGCAGGCVAVRTKLADLFADRLDIIFIPVALDRRDRVHDLSEMLIEWTDRAGCYAAASVVSNINAMCADFFLNCFTIPVNPKPLNHGVQHGIPLYVRCSPKPQQAQANLCLHADEILYFENLKISGQADVRYRLLLRLCLKQPDPVRKRLQLVVGAFELLNVLLSIEFCFLHEPLRDPVGIMFCAFV